MTPDDPIEIKPPAIAVGAKASVQAGGAPPADSSPAHASDTGAHPAVAHPVKDSSAPTAAKPASAAMEPAPVAEVQGAASPPKPAAAKPAAPPKPPPPPAPFVPRPSIPVSMINSPADSANPHAHAVEERFSGELDEDFETALKRVILAPRRRPVVTILADAILRMISAKSRPRRADYARARRAVAFDGFRTNLHDEKLERDRRYGTVYIVAEEVNAYLVRLEMPRRMPNSSLKRTWNLPDQMPDYDYSLSLSDGVLTIRAGVPGEACRRLSYVSSSFPSDFLTRIEFAKPVDGFQHRLRDKVLEIVVFKRGASLRSAA